MLEVSQLIKPPLYSGESTKYSIGEKIGLWGARHLILRRIISLGVLLIGLFYLLWRVFYTNIEVHPFLFYSLLSAEIFGWISFALFLHDAWLTNPPFVKPPGNFSVDILIPSYDEPIEIVEPTIYAATLARGKKTVYFLDDGRRAWGAQLCKKYGAQYVVRGDNRNAKAGNINAALHLLTSDLVLVLDADHVCDPAILERMTGYFDDPQLGVLQTAHDFRNHDSAQHQSSGSNEQSLFFDVLLTGRNRSQAAFWCGSAGMIRRQALLENGGLSTDTITEDLETTLDVQRLGWTSLYVPERLIHGLAPQNLAGYLLQRDRWARGTLQILLGKKSPIFRGGFTMSTRISYLSNLFYYLNPVQRFVYSYVLLATLIFGVMPMKGFSWQLFTLWSLWNVGAILASALLSLGRTTPFEGSKNIWITGDVYVRALFSTILRKRVKFAVTPKIGIDTGGVEALRLTGFPIFMAILTMVAIVTRIVEIYLSEQGVFLFSQLPIFASLVAIFYGCFEVFVVYRAVHHLYKRHQIRVHWRFPVHLVSRIDGKAAICFDLNQDGAGFISDQALGEVGEEKKIEIDLTTTPGERETAHAVMTIARSVSTDSGVQTGGRIVWGCDDCSHKAMHHINITVPFGRRGN